MRRLITALEADVRLQFRNGFYYAAGFVALFWILVLIQLPSYLQITDRTLSWLLPVFLLSNLILNTFYFIAALLFLEKGEGTLMAVIVTPLRRGEYLTSKLITLTLLSLLENLLIAWAAGLPFNPVALLAGLGLAALILVLTGLIAVSRYDSINEYLFPSILYTLLFVPPFLDYLELVESPWFYLHPLMPTLLLTEAAFQQVPTWQWFYGMTYGAFWVVIFFILSRRALDRFAMSAQGVR